MLLLPYKTLRQPKQFSGLLAPKLYYLLPGSFRPIRLLFLKLYCMRESFLSFWFAILNLNSMKGKEGRGSF